LLKRLKQKNNACLEYQNPVKLDERLNGVVEPKVSEAKAIEEIFADMASQKFGAMI
jgi:hypothetical protein